MRILNDSGDLVERYRAAGTVNQRDRPEGGQWRSRTKRERPRL